jgi:hypothetical protein
MHNISMHNVKSIELEPIVKFDDADTRFATRKITIRSTDYNDNEVSITLTLFTDYDTADVLDV